MRDWVLTPFITERQNSKTMTNVCYISFLLLDLEMPERVSKVKKGWTSDRWEATSKIIHSPFSFPEEQLFFHFLLICWVGELTVPIQSGEGSILWLRPNFMAPTYPPPVKSAFLSTRNHLSPNPSLDSIYKVVALWDPAPDWSRG